MNLRNRIHRDQKRKGYVNGQSAIDEKRGSLNCCLRIGALEENWGLTSQMKKARLRQSDLTGTPTPRLRRTPFALKLNDPFPLGWWRRRNLTPIRSTNQIISINLVYSTPYRTSNPFYLPDFERNLILYIFPKQRTDVGSNPIRRPPVITPQT